MEQEQNTSGAPAPTNSPFLSASGDKNSTMLIGVGVVVLIIILLAWYMMQGSSMTTENPTPTAPQVQNTAPTPTESSNMESGMAADSAAAALSTQGTSDEVSAIEADANTTDLTSLNDIDTI